MASLLDRYGIKEVADITFYKLDDNGQPTRPVLYIDTAKVSTIEQTAEQSDARGGKGNPKLITWDYGKEITVTIEDALFSAKSMAMMFGDDHISEDVTAISRSINYIAKGTTVPSVYRHGETVFNTDSTGADQSLAATWYDESDSTTAVTTMVEGKRYIGIFNLTPTKAKRIEINANTFPGNYYVTGDTYARSDASGKDEFFQFIIKKAKMSSEQTITLEAEGDPSVFNMNLTVLRPTDGSAMMELVQYSIANG